MCSNRSWSGNTAAYPVSKHTMATYRLGEQSNQKSICLQNMCRISNVSKSISCCGFEAKCADVEFLVSFPTNVTICLQVTQSCPKLQNSSILQITCIGMRLSMTIEITDRQKMRSSFERISYSVTNIRYNDREPSIFIDKSHVYIAS